MHHTTKAILEAARTTPKSAPPARVPLECVYEGSVLEWCHSCGSGSRHTRKCDLHGICTRLPHRPGVRACSECADRIAEDAHPNIIAADAFLRTLPEYDNTLEGDGIVIVGGTKYWASVYVTLRMLQHLRCQLPVEVYYTEGEEPPEYIKAKIVNLGAIEGFPDPSKRNGPRHPPFQLKSMAAMQSRFRRILVLDADSYPCIDPMPLLNDPQGAIFWPDRQESAAWTRWADWGVEPFGPDCGLEVGQYVIDKKKAWRPFNLMHWYDQHGDWCYGWGQHHDHGDKGPARVAFAKCKYSWTMFHTEADWRIAAFVHRNLGGKPAFVHRCQSKFVLSGTEFASTPQLQPNMRLGLPLEDEAFRFLQELM